MSFSEVFPARDTETSWWELFDLVLGAKLTAREKAAVVAFMRQL